VGAVEEEGGASSLQLPGSCCPASLLSQALMPPLNSTAIACVDRLQVARQLDLALSTVHMMRHSPPSAREKEGGEE